MVLIDLFYLSLSFSSTLAFQPSLHFDFCGQHSLRSPFDLSCSRPIEPAVLVPTYADDDEPKPQEAPLYPEEPLLPEYEHVMGWSIYPSCLRQENRTEKYCVYTDLEFASNRGISFFARTNMSASIQSLPAFADPSLFENVNKEPTNPPYVQKEIPGKGLGLVATRPIRRGEVIFSHTPVFMLDEGAYDHFLAEDRHPFYSRAIRQLPASTAAGFDALMGHFGGDPVEDIINTNCFAVELWSDDLGEMIPFNAVLPEVSRMNHDCRPNAHYYFDPSTLIQHTHALRTIIPGEEITISYIDPAQTSADRMEALHNSWGFPCGCNACTAHTPLREASDQRVEKILELQDELTDYSPSSLASSSPDAGRKMAELLVTLYELEGMLGPIAEAHAIAALEFNSAMDKWGAVTWATKAVESSLLYGGPRDGDLRVMKALLDNPEGHWSWGVREKKRAEEMEKEIEAVEKKIEAEERRARRE